MTLNYLTTSDIEILSKPLFKTGVDYSFGSDNGKKGNGNCVSVFYGNKSDPYMIYDLDLMVGLTREAELALEKMKNIANQVKLWCVLDKGDLLIVDNNRSVHGRSEFIPKYDGKDRWLMRTCAVQSLIPSAEDRNNTRIINTTFEI